MTLAGGCRGIRASISFTLGALGRHRLAERSTALVATLTFADLLVAAQRRNNSLLCVGLDPDLRHFPPTFRDDPTNIAAFNRAIIEATADIACCYKPNLGFYLAYGLAGIEALAQLRADVPAHIPVLLDAKVGDMSNTVAAYARGYFETFGFDAVTAHVYQGYDAVEPLLRYRDRGVFILCKTSNPNSGQLQDRVLEDGQTVAAQVARWAGEWNAAGNIGLVVGATYPEQLAATRRLAPDLPILVPGVGAQAGDLEASVRGGVDARNAGLLINASRAISYASAGDDFQEAARREALRLRAAINDARA